jgi:hypothetical protein
MASPMEIFSSGLCPESSNCALTVATGADSALVDASPGTGLGVVVRLPCPGTRVPWQVPWEVWVSRRQI